MGASGAVVDSGSFMDVVADTAAAGERDAMALLQQGDLESWRAENAARNYDAQKNQALASRVDPTSAVAGSLLSSAAKMGESYFRLQSYAGSAPGGGSGGDSALSGHAAKSAEGINFNMASAW